MPRQYAHVVFWKEKYEVWSMKIKKRSEIRNSVWKRVWQFNTDILGQLNDIFYEKIKKNVKRFLEKLETQITFKSSHNDSERVYQLRFKIFQVLELPSRERYVLLWKFPLKVLSSR